MTRDRDTVVMACHLYRVDEQRFKALCRVERRFHSEILRELILDWIDLKSNNLPEYLKSKGEAPKETVDELASDVAERVKDLLEKNK